MTETAATVSPDASAAAPAPEVDTITLGARTVTVLPLTLGQLRVILPAFTRAGKGGAESVEASIDIIHAAASRAEPTLTRDDVASWEATVPDMLTATGKIAVLAGLVTVGETKAATASLSSGTGSTPA